MRLQAIACCLLIGLAGVSRATEASCRDLTYESRNQTDYGPLLVASIRGTAQDAQGGPIPKTCVGVFTETDHRLIAVTRTDAGGRFELKGIPDGDYRLVAKYEGFCPANAKLHVERGKKIKTLLAVQMRFAGLDTCSYVELK